MVNSNDSDTLSHGDITYYSGAGWLERSLHKELSPFGMEVANILGAVWKGIYHLRESSLKRADWTAKDFIQLNLQTNGIATYDFSEMTQLVIYCHDRAIRLEIDGVAPGLLKLSFSQRQHEGGDMFTYHPTIEKAIQSARKIWAG